MAERSEPQDSPVQVTIAAGLVRKSRSERNTDLGFGVDDEGRLAGADERADELSTMPAGGEKAALLEEIDKRYWKTTGIAEGSKIKNTLEQGKIVIWNETVAFFLAHGKGIVANFKELDAAQFRAEFLDQPPAPEKIS